MNDLQRELIAKAKTLLEEKQVDGVLGFSRGSLPMARRPFLARNLEDAEQLCWDEFCLLNLANFLPARSDAITAVTAKGCDWRNLVVHHQEGRIDLPSHIVVLGIDCEGMLDPEKIYQAAGGPERVLEVSCTGEQITITVTSGELVIERNELYRQACLDCIQRAPLSVDHLLQNPEPRQLPRVTAPPVEEPPKGSREAVLRATFKDCLMCFACRDVCPLCYCSRCFVDVEKSHWLSAQESIDRILDFHFMRAHHIAGRCTECGSCETACPMNIPVRQLATRLNRELAQSSGYIPGLELSAEAPEGVFRPSYHEHSGRRT